MYNKNAMRQFDLTSEEKKTLLRLARAEIKGSLTGNREEIDPPPQPGGLYTHQGAFVTLHIKGRLRGCIGIFSSTQPLYQTVRDMAYSAAFKDPRFPPLTAEEFPDIDIEISVLSPLRRIDNIDEIEIGKHGLYIVKGYSRGVLLPQVAVENNWDKFTFLEYTCLKADLETDCWRSGAEIYIFTALIFSEKDLESAG